MISDKTRQDNTTHANTWDDQARKGTTRQYNIKRQGDARQHNIIQYKATQYTIMQKHKTIQDKKRQFHTRGDNTWWYNRRQYKAIQPNIPYKIRQYKAAQGNTIQYNISQDKWEQH